MAAVAVRSWSPTVGDRRPSIACTPAFTALHETSNVARSQSGVSAINPARCNQGTASIATGPAANTASDAPISPRAR
jgi:hypothetical protein